jgi:acyl carrier protein
MTRDDAQIMLATVLHEIAPEVEIGTLDPDAPFQQEADIDSMDFLNLVAGLHEQSGIDIPEDDYPKLSTLSDILAYLEQRVGIPD